MLADRKEYVCVPIYLYSDLEAYNNFGIKVCVQKIMFYMNSLLASPDSKENIQALEEKKRLEAFI